MKLIEQIRRLATPHIKHYQSDLDHDENTLKTYKGRFLLYVNPNGTHMITLDPVESYPEAGERVKYLFGTADRFHLLDEKMNLHKAIERQRYVKLLLYFDGKKLVRTNMNGAKDIIRVYIDKTRKIWKKEFENKMQDRADTELSYL